MVPPVQQARLLLLNPPQLLLRQFEPVLKVYELTTAIKTRYLLYLGLSQLVHLVPSRLPLPLLLTNIHVSVIHPLAQILTKSLARFILNLSGRKLIIHWTFHMAVLLNRSVASLEEPNTVGCPEKEVFDEHGKT